MVRFATLALFLLSATSVVLDARPTHKRRALSCRETTTTTKAATATKANIEAVKTTTKTSTKFVTKTTTSSKATGTPDSSDDADAADDNEDDGNLSGSVTANALFPVKGVTNGWSVAKASIPQAKDLSLTDKTFIVRKEASTSKRPVVTFNGKKAIKAHMAKGQCTI